MSPSVRACRARPGTRPVAFATAVISIAVFEPSTNSTSMRAFMLRSRASLFVGVGGGVELQRVVLAFSRRHNLETERLGETDRSTVAAGSSPAAP